MTEPPIPATGHGSALASYNAVFIDTSLETHLAVQVSSSNTVADLKRIILDEHPLCFPKFGEIEIDALKVKKRGIYYHLVESIPLKSAFDGMRKGWFVSVEASIVSKGSEIEPEKANLALVTMNTGFEEEGANVVIDGRHHVLPERELLVSQNESNDLHVEVAGGAQLAGGDVRGDKVLSMVPLISDESLREEKCDKEEAQEMDVATTEIGKGLSNIDASSILPEEASGVKVKRRKRKRSKTRADDLSGKVFDVSMQKLAVNGGEEEMKVPETTALQKRREVVVVEDMQISDQNAAGIQTGGVIALAEESEAQVVHVEFSNDGSKGYIVNQFEDNLDDRPVANKKRKTGIERDDEAALRESRTIVSESNGITCESPALSQQYATDEPQVAAILGVPNANSVEVVNQLASQSFAKKKRRTKSSRKLDKKTAGVTPDEANAGEEIHLKEAGINGGNGAEEPPPSDAHMLQPSAVSLTEKDPGPLQEQQNNLLSQVINEFQEPMTNETNRVETEQAVPEMVSAEVQKEVVDSMLREVDAPVDNGKASKKIKKSRKHTIRMSGTIPIPSNADHVTDIPSREAEKVGKDDNSIHEASEKGDVKEPAVADCLRANLLVTNKEINEVIKNAVESAQQSAPPVAENKEGKPRKKTKKKHGSDGKNSVLLRQPQDMCTNEIIPSPSTVNIHGTDSWRFDLNTNLKNPSCKDSLDRAQIKSPAEKVGSDSENASEVDGVNFHPYFIPRDQNKKTADPSEVGGAWTQTLKEKLEAQAKPREKKAEPSSGKVDKRKPHLEEAQESNALTCPNGGKPKKGIEHHHCESSTNSSSHSKIIKSDRSQSQQTSVNGGRGSSANPGGVVNGMAAVARAPFKRNPSGDDSDDSLESYHFPSPLNQSRASSPGIYPHLSVSPVHLDGERGAA